MERRGYVPVIILEHACYLLKPGEGWYVSTLAAAEQLYDSLLVCQKLGSITITDLSLPFWQAIYPAAKSGSWFKNSNAHESSSMYRGLYDAMQVYADGFVDIVRNNTPEDGSMSERFSKFDGTPSGAQGFSWTNGAFLSMKDRREGKVPPSWGALDAARNKATTCNVTRLRGTYIVPDRVQWPAIPCKPLSVIQITFNLLSQHITEGSSVYIYGSIQELGSWDPNKALLMDAPRYNRERDLPLWRKSLRIAVGTEFEYKYRIDDGNGTTSQIYRFQVKKGTCWYAAATDDKW